MLARFSPEKDHITLLHAWRQVIDSLKRVERRAILVLAGSWQGTESCAGAITHELFLEEHVRLLRHVDDVGGLLAATDIGVLSSRTEGLPNSVLESMWTGLPVVGTDIPGIREAVGPDGAQYLAPVGDARALAERILGFAADIGLRKKVGDANRQRIHEHFSISSMLEGMTSIIASCIATGPARASCRAAAGLTPALDAQDPPGPEGDRHLERPVRGQ
jgi:glycosyltransferase involved in cell wall biosynthesis